MPRPCIPGVLQPGHRRIDPVHGRPPPDAARMYFDSTGAACPAGRSPSISTPTKRNASRLPQAKPISPSTASSTSPALGRRRRSRWACLIRSGTRDRSRSKAWSSSVRRCTPRRCSRHSAASALKARPRLAGRRRIRSSSSRRSGSSAMRAEPPHHRSGSRISSSRRSRRRKGIRRTPLLRAWEAESRHPNQTGPHEHHVWCSVASRERALSRGAVPSLEPLGWPGESTPMLAPELGKPRGRLSRVRPFRRSSRPTAAEPPTSSVIIQNARAGRGTVTVMVLLELFAKPLLSCAVIDTPIVA